jgi:hypothetical protein
MAAVCLVVAVVLVLAAVAEVGVLAVARTAGRASVVGTTVQKFL